MKRLLMSWCLFLILLIPFILVSVRWGAIIGLVWVGGICFMDLSLRIVDGFLIKNETVSIKVKQ